MARHLTPPHSTLGDHPEVTSGPFPFSPGGAGEEAAMGRSDPVQLLNVALCEAALPDLFLSFIALLMGLCRREEMMQRQRQMLLWEPYSHLASPNAQ